MANSCLRFLHLPGFPTTNSLFSRRRLTVKAQSSAPPPPPPPSEQLNLSVLRFTLGIPGLDESYLPRYIGVGFGSLILLNQFLSSDPTPAQLRSEVLGVCLSAFSVALPYLGRFLEGVTSKDRLALPEGSKQIFILSENLSESQKENMAWASYALLRSTNTVSVLIAINDELCIRGYWNTTEDLSRVEMIDRFKSQIQESGLIDLRETLHFPKFTDSEFMKILPKEVVSVVVQPVFSASNTWTISNSDSDSNSDSNSRTNGFVLLASNSNYAYSDKDIAWIRAVASKFQSIQTVGISGTERVATM